MHFNNSSDHETPFEDDRQIILTEPHKINYWCNKLRTTEEMLRRIIAIMGDNANKVKAYLDDMRSSQI